MDRPPISLDDAALDVLLDANPDHPDLLGVLRRRIDEGDELDETSVALLDRYAAARPVDPYPHRVLARHLLAEGRGDEAIPWSNSTCEARRTGVPRDRGRPGRPATPASRSTRRSGRLA